MNNNLFTCLLVALLFCQAAQAQKKIIGADDHEGVTVLSSSSYSPEHWDRQASGEQTINGSGLDYNFYDASRFLMQATLGANRDEIQRTMDMGYQSWLDEQFDMQRTILLDELAVVFTEVQDWFIANGGDPEELGSRPYWNVFNYTWWNSIITKPDALRHRIATALSEIFVISINSDLGDYGKGLASYYDLLSRNAFGNFQDLLMDVTLHPCMGYYLSHLNNPKAIPEENIHPDENYAREIMQLFSIGLYELNQDGTRKLDDQGKYIPTYGQREITEFAKIFTGLSISDIDHDSYNPEDYIPETYFGMGLWHGDLTKPMKMYEEWHQQGPKTLLGDVTIPSGQSGMEDIEAAIENIFNHPNVGPFIGHLLIQRLVKSNPTPSYVERVAEAFNDNGNGIRGDMKAVIRAILLDPEARSCESFQDPANGKLREPMLRYTQVVKANDIEQYYGRYWNVGYDFMDQTGQTIFGAPSVFNFFLPEFQPLGPIADQGLVAPEFQIHNSRTSIGYINQVNRWVVWESVMNSWEHNDPHSRIVIDELKNLARDPEALVNELDAMYTHGTLSNSTREIIKNTLYQFVWGDYRADRVRMALYLMLISPDYSIQK